MLVEKFLTSKDLRVDWNIKFKPCTVRNEQAWHTVFLLLSLTAICVSPSASSADEKPKYLCLTIPSDFFNNRIRNLIGPEIKGQGKKRYKKKLWRLRGRTVGSQKKANRIATCLPKITCILFSLVWHAGSRKHYARKNAARTPRAPLSILRLLLPSACYAVHRWACSVHYQHRPRNFSHFLGERPWGRAWFNTPPLSESLPQAKSTSGIGLGWAGLLWAPFRSDGLNRLCFVLLPLTTWVTTTLHETPPDFK